MLAGAITQSSVAVTSITVSMLKSELISTRQGFLVVIGAQLGVALLILVWPSTSSWLRSTRLVWLAS